MIKAKISRRTRICQGDIIRDVEYIEHLLEKHGVLEISKISFPLVIVLTQDCDLVYDHECTRNNITNHDKKLISVIVAPLYNIEHVCAGSHLVDLGMNMQVIDKKMKNLIVTNQNKRYHFLEFPDNVPIVNSVIDFKHYFTVNSSYLRDVKRNNFVCTLSDIYIADVLQRFAAFLSRIGLPELS